MKILADRNIKSLFCRIFLCISAFMLLSALILNLGFRHGALSVFLCALCMALAITGACYGYFREQDRIIREAAQQIGERLSGSADARIECSEEGELYRLFHEVNSLVSILNAHAKKEGEAREFLKNTLSDVSHQLKTPIAALHIYNGIIQEESGHLPAVQEFAILSEQELDRIQALVQNLLKIARFDAGSIAMERSWEQVADMMRGVKRHFSFRAGQEGKEIILDGPENVLLWCDRTWLMEAVGNLVKNALDHTETGGWVQMEWRQSGSIVRIVVKDNGSGIHPEDLYHIFKRFYRSRFSKDVQGVGLGLPLAKAVMEAHGGTVEVDSVLGAGASFTVNFLVPVSSRPDGSLKKE